MFPFLCVAFVIELMWNEGFKKAHYSNASHVFEQVPSSSSASIVSNTTGCLSAQDDQQIGKGFLFVCLFCFRNILHCICNLLGVEYLLLGILVGLTSLKPGVKKTQPPRPTVSKGSTLMKPTASHLAKLNQRKEVPKSARYFLCLNFF